PKLIENKDRYQFYIACLLSEKLHVRAEKAIGQGIKKYPDDPQFQVNMAQLHFGQKRYQQVINVATKGLKAFPDSHPLHVMAANAYSKLSQKNKAIRHYDRALSVNPDDVHARNRLAQLYREKKKQDDEYFHQGVVYFYTGDFRQAKEVLGWVKKDYEKPAELKYYQGMVYWALKESDKGITYLKESIGIKGDYHLPYLALSEAYYARDSQDKAREILKTYRDKYPDSKHIKEIERKITELKKRN
ncbi:MAG: tetratricopeptide repeat protein, partial [Spirochaetota bacterium]|nr:tetratricopeptide repeat protein [Spirochaetota bacterium]